MDSLERSRDIYEAIPGYAPAPQPPLPAEGDLSTLETIGLRLTGFSKAAINAAMTLTGFKSFWRTLPDSIEHLQRTVNLRGPALYAQAVSATLALADDPRPLTPFERAATLVAGVVSLHDDYFSARLPADTVRGEPAEMGQYANLFATSVVFENNLPRLYKSKATDRIAVLVRGRFFVVEIGRLGSDASLADLAATLESCADLAAEAEQEGQERSVARLTAASDMTQRRVMPILSQRPANADSFEALKDTLVTVCLDLDAEPDDLAEAALIGHRDNIDNRWWYASLQLVVFGNARAVALCSFSAYLDGNVMMRGSAEIVRRAAAAALDPPASLPHILPIRELHWDVGEPAYNMAERDIRLLRDAQPVATYEFDGFGQRFFDAARIDPVPGFVLALEVASRRLIGRTPRITQFLAMSRYRCTDLVTTMVTTPEVEAFTEYAVGEAPDSERGHELMLAAIEAQKATMREARKSMGLPTVFRLFINSEPAKRTFRGVTKRTTTALLRRAGLFKPQAREIVISFPALYPEAPIVGRPGARLPYTKFFGLHYQIWDDKTVVTFMPGTEWQTSNDELAAELGKGFAFIQQITESAAN